jgi:hypothetical protein
VRAAVAAFGRVAHRYEHLALARYDITLRSPLHSWNCTRNGTLQRDTLCLSSRCSQQEWATWRCISDVFQLVPRALFPQFAAALGNETRRQITPRSQLVFRFGAQP